MLSDGVSMEMVRKQHVVDLSEEDRNTLEWFISTVNGKLRTSLGREFS